MKNALPFLLALALAACADTNDESASADEVVTATVETPIPVEPNGGIGDGAGPPDEVQEALANRIPTRFQGVWDYVEGTCARESDLRKEISGSEILFYESIGTVTAVTTEGEDVIVTLAMEGEGEVWEQQTRLSLKGEGPSQQLETTDGSQPKRPDDYPSKRCP